MMKLVRYILMALVATVLTTSCIKDDLDECHNVTIYFQYLADGDKDVLNQYMSKVDLYVFDSNGHILGVGSYNQDELTKFEAVPSFKLRPGQRYRVVAVGNPYDHTEVVNYATETNFANIYLQDPAWSDPNVPVTNHDYNYLGEKEFVMPDQEGVMYRDTVTLYSAHVKVFVEIHGLPAPSGTRQTAGIPYQLSFENSNAQVSFNNEINLNEKGSIYPDLIYDSENQCYRTQNLALFRMDSEGELSAGHCEHTLVLTDINTGTELVRGNLYNYLVRNADVIDVTKQEAELPISIVFSEMNVEIKVPDWVIVNGKPDWN
ncbi:FimB/Mfa2 family fimbrial subunit [Phocaeicola barnesiae]|uniref:FimB/Mfa2 family fimbrial subunit n=1 Tax=Phocaeicola barnesiae TaxID=376804 RepID=UPI00046F7237|nr:FimB/Mfa2 family fimbrial subunit [Phocaeicola barnesiae]